MALLHVYAFLVICSFGTTRQSSVHQDSYTPISKNVVGENGEWQLSNGNCTTERNCGFHTWYAKTMSYSRGAKLLEGA